MVVLMLYRNIPIKSHSYKSLNLSLFHKSIHTISKPNMSTSDFLLDRALIHDLVTTLYWAFDTRQPELLRSQVFAKAINVDYTAFFGGEPSQRTNEEIVKSWKELMDKIEASQHIVTGVLSSLVNSSPDTQTTASVSANGTAYLRKKTADRKVIETRNGGRIEIVMVREGSILGTNPWRIAGLKAVPVWDVGGKEFWGAQ